MEAAAADVELLTAAEANRLYGRATAPPPVLTEPHAKRLATVIRRIIKRLDTLKLDWLIEKFKELDSTLRNRFLKIVADL